MTKSKAQKEVQRLMKQAEDLLAQAGEIMDEHGFTSQFMGLDYMVRHEYDADAAADGNNPFGFYVEDVDGDQFNEHYGGQWLPSSSWRGC